MGGTQFNGLALVHELVRQGHDVTIVNRGQTDAPLPEGINRLYACLLYTSPSPRD